MVSTTVDTVRKEKDCFISTSQRRGIGVLPRGAFSAFSNTKLVAMEGRQELIDEMTIM